MDDKQKAAVAVLLDAAIKEFLSTELTEAGTIKHADNAQDDKKITAEHILELIGSQVISAK